MKAPINVASMRAPINVASMRAPINIGVYKSTFVIIAYMTKLCELCLHKAKPVPMPRQENEEMVIPKLNQFFIKSIGKP